MADSSFINESPASSPKWPAAVAGKWSVAVSGTIQSNQHGDAGGDKSSPDRAINCIPVEPKFSDGILQHTGVFNASSNKDISPKLEGKHFGWFTQSPT
jgi:hypothetical protein